MANANYADMVDPRLLEAAWHRFETARAAHAARAQLNQMQERYRAAANEHLKATAAYDALEADIARGVRAGKAA